MERIDSFRGEYFFLSNFHCPDEMEHRGVIYYKPAQIEDDRGDTFWGVCEGVGENWLGKILMETRSRIVAEENPSPEFT